MVTRECKLEVWRESHEVSMQVADQHFVPACHFLDLLFLHPLALVGLAGDRGTGADKAHEVRSGVRAGLPVLAGQALDLHHGRVVAKHAAHEARQERLAVRAHTVAVQELLDRKRCHREAEPALQESPNFRIRLDPFQERFEARAFGVRIIFGRHHLRDVLAAVAACYRHFTFMRQQREFGMLPCPVSALVVHCEAQDPGLGVDRQRVGVEILDLPVQAGHRFRQKVLDTVGIPGRSGEGLVALPGRTLRPQLFRDLVFFRLQLPAFLKPLFVGHIVLVPFERVQLVVDVLNALNA